MFGQYNGVIRAVAEREGVHFVDMFERFGHDPDHFVDAFHFTASGIRRFARIYTDALREVLEGTRPVPEPLSSAGRRRASPR